MQTPLSIPPVTSANVLQLASSLDNLGLRTDSGYHFLPLLLASTSPSITSDSSILYSSQTHETYALPSSQVGETSSGAFRNGGYSPTSHINIAAPQPRHLGHNMTPDFPPYARVKGSNEHRGCFSDSRSEIYTGCSYAPYSTNLYGHETSRRWLREVEKNCCSDLQDCLPGELQEQHFRADFLTKTRTAVMKRITLQVRELSALNEQLKTKVAWGEAEITKRDAEIAYLNKVIEALRGLLRGMLNIDL